jgi:hypothetical protein
MPIEHAYRDARTEAEPLLRAAGVRPSAVIEFLDQFAGQFLHTYDAATETSELVYRGSDPEWKGLCLEEAIATLKKTRPHYFYSEPDDIAVLAEAAFGERPSLTARGKLAKELGSHGAYLEMASRWGSDGVSMKPGTRPGSVEAKSREKAEPTRSHSDNPWSENFRGDRVAAQTSIIRAMGTKVAASMAKSAGVTLSGQPLRR